MAAVTEAGRATFDRPVRIAAARTGIGLAQGIALYGLFEASQLKAWPATHGPLFVALCTTTVFVPLIVVSAFTQLRPRILIGWTLAATLICVGLSWYDIYRDPIALPLEPRNWPSPQLSLGLALGLFIGH